MFVAAVSNKQQCFYTMFYYLVTYIVKHEQVKFCCTKLMFIVIVVVLFLGGMVDRSWITNADNQTQSWNAIDSSFLFSFFLNLQPLAI